MPQGPYLKAIRTAIYNDPGSFRELISEKSFKNTFGEMFGEKLKGAPRGFPKEFPDLELIQFKHYAVSHSVDNDFWVEGDPVAAAMKVFKKQYPFNTFLNKIVEKVG
jgi:uncharacterized protein (DUF2461 family)